jgi:hypothetical protein
MPHFPTLNSRKRSPRVRVPNDEAIRINIGGKSITAILQRLSLTGGLAVFQASITPGTLGEVHMKTTNGPVKGLIEFLKPQKSGGNAHPFRFVALDDSDFKRLNQTLQLMRKMGLGDDAS